MSSTATPSIQWQLGSSNATHKVREPKFNYDSEVREALVRPVELTWDEQLNSIARRLHLREELHRASFRLLASFQLLLLTVTAQFITPYWILGFLLVVPFALGEAAHVLTVFVASQRKTNGSASQQ